MAAKRMPPLAAPLDFQPRTVIIEFDAVEQPADLRIVLDPDNEIAEITEASNALGAALGK